jgi:hypothetical protein
MSDPPCAFHFVAINDRFARLARERRLSKRNQ